MLPPVLQVLGRSHGSDPGGLFGVLSTAWMPVQAHLPLLGLLNEPDVHVVLVVERVRASVSKDISCPVELLRGRP